MPRISDGLLESVIYLYPSVSSAENGEKLGGSGFLVGIRSEKYPNKAHNYAVTNSHVIREGAAPVIRLNTADGQVDILELGIDEWLHHPDGDDVAICPIDISPEFHQIRRVPPEMFLTKAIIKEHSIGPGDEVFFIGRFISHEGNQRNLPSVRFGNISQMPWEPIRHPTRGIDQESFLVEARSLSGYSGSPVFVVILPWSIRPDQQMISSGTRGPFLLGIDWCHFPDWKQVMQSDKQIPVPEKWYVEQNSGIAGVVPAWKLAELLDSEDLMRKRKEQEETWKADYEKSDVVGGQ